MSKVIICLTGCLMMAFAGTYMMDGGNAARQSITSSRRIPLADTVASPTRDTVVTAKDTTGGKPAETPGGPVTDTVPSGPVNEVIGEPAAPVKTDEAKAETPATEKPKRSKRTRKNKKADDSTADTAVRSDTPAPAPADTAVKSGTSADTAAATAATTTPATTVPAPATTTPATTTPATTPSTTTPATTDTTGVSTVVTANVPVTANTTVTNNNPAKPDSSQMANVNSKTDGASGADGASSGNPTSKADSTAKSDVVPEEAGKTDYDRRWFISPLLKVQFQDFGMLEKNRKGYLSDANTLPMQKRGNGSFAASAYKNLTGRLSISADIGLSFGHVTNKDVLISQTQSKTYNLLNASVYYHLLPASYRLQPYVTVGINDLINDKSYLTAPMGVGAKFNARKVMVLGQISYGYGVNKNTASSTMYSLGIYIPLKSKKQKKQDEEDKAANKKKDDDKKKDTSKIVINNYININMDSILKAKGLLNEDGSPRSGRGGDGDDDGNGGSGGRGKRKKGLRDDLKLDEDGFTSDDFKVDTIDGVPVIRFVVYFEFNEYGLNSKAFSSIDRVIGHLKLKQNLNIEIKGYTDDIGAESYNNMLSRKRAKMVLDYLNSRGVPSELMKAKAYGSDNPVADNRDPNQAWLNRRAEIIVREK